MIPDPQEPHLAGCVVLITVDRRSGELTTVLERRGAIVRHTPALSMVPLGDDLELIAATRRVIELQPDVVVATTGVGFRGWMEAADTAGLAEPLHEVLSRARIVARGPKARGAIQAAGLAADWVAESETSEELAEFLLAEGLEGLRIAVQHHGSGADGIDERFTAAGAQVTGLVVYRWGPPVDADQLALWAGRASHGEVDAVVFTSAPGAAAWLRALPDGDAQRRLAELGATGRTVFVAVGPVTAKPLRDAGIEPLVPNRGRLGALIRELVAHYAKQAESAISTVAGPLQLRATHAVLGHRAIEISPNGMAVLRLLSRSPGAVVNRQEILDELPGEAQTSHAADVAVARLREALGEPAIITTVYKRGYRLNVPE